MLTLLLTLPGVAVIYNGDEIGMLDSRDIPWEDTLDLQACNKEDQNVFSDASRDPQRTPFQWDDTAYAGFKKSYGAQPWIKVNPNYSQLNLALQQSAPKSFYKFYQQLATLRNDDIFKSGTFESHAFNDEVFAYKRTFNGHSFVILINFAANEHTINVNDLIVGFPDESQVALAGSKSSYDAG
jgi:alpha-glucosidase